VDDQPSRRPGGAARARGGPEARQTMLSELRRAARRTGTVGPVRLALAGARTLAAASPLAEPLLSPCGGADRYGAAAPR
jgi:hypothetical protein